jgi:hypothetical protein
LRNTVEKCDACAATALVTINIPAEDGVLAETRHACFRHVFDVWFGKNNVKHARVEEP